MYKPPQGPTNLIYKDKDRIIKTYGRSTAECDKKLSELLVSNKVVAGIIRDVKDDKEPLVKLGPGGDYVRNY